MSAQIVTVSSPTPGVGKTLVAAALCRWIRREHLPVCPFVLTNGTAADAHSLEVLARAADLVERTAPTGGISALEAEAANWEYIVVECASGREPAGATGFELINAPGEGLSLVDHGSGCTFRAGWYKATALFPDVPADVAALPEWSFGNAPRVGVVSLPHLHNFADFRLFRGAEWISSPPGGLFDLVLIPFSSRPDFDRAWLGETGIGAWIERMREQGCRICGVGDSMGEKACVGEGELQDFRVASRVLGRRLPAPEPEDAALEAAAVWLESIVGPSLLRQRALGRL